MLMTRVSVMTKNLVFCLRATPCFFINTRVNKASGMDSLLYLRPQYTHCNGCFPRCHNIVSQSLVFIPAVKAQEAPAVFS